MSEVEPRVPCFRPDCGEQTHHEGHPHNRTVGGERPTRGVNRLSEAERDEWQANIDHGDFR